MRVIAFAALFALLHVAISAAQPPRSLSPGQRQVTDSDLFIGAWNIIGLEAGGKAEPEKNYKGNTILFLRDRFPGRLQLPAVLGYRGSLNFVVHRDRAILREGNFQPIDFLVSVDSTKSPRTIDLTTKGKTLQGIYKLEGDDLILCLSVGGTRPTDFTTRPELPVESFTLRRGWERYVEKTGGWSVELPGRAETRSRKLPTPDGMLTASLAVFRSESDQVTYVTTALPVGAAPPRAGWQQVVEPTRELLLTAFSPGGKPMSETGSELTAPGYTGCELLLSVEEPGQKERTSLRVRLLSVGDRWYLLAAIGTGEAVRTKNADRFFNSFRPPVEKKDRPTKS